VESGFRKSPRIREMRAAFWILGFFLAAAAYVWFTDVDQDFQDLLRNNDISLDIFGRYSGYTLGALFKASTGYGEVTVKGMQAIYDMARRHHIRTFYDIGCGIGKSLLMALLLGFERAVGVEIVNERVDIARQMQAKLPTSLKTAMTISQGDWATELKIPENTPIMIFVSNLLWSEEESRRLFQFLAKTTPRGSIIISSVYYATDGLEKIDTLLVPMSWFHYSYCEAVQVLPQPFKAPEKLNGT
jgi:SAM-dependent methyltransferase